MYFSNLLRLGAVLIVTLCLKSVTVEAQEMFTNPILDENSADPAVLFHNGFYYLTLSTDGMMSMTVYKSKVLTSFREAETKVLYRCPEGNFNLWASEMHFIQGELYIYFTMDGNQPHHKMYVMKADDPTDPMGTWGEPIRMMQDWPERAIDGTVMKHGNGKLYFAWSSEAHGPLSIYIAEMEDPVTVKESKLYLRGPQSPWEGGPGGVNEGPYFIYNKNVSYMVFSAESTWGPNYCLGLMSIPSDLDPMVPSNWWYGDDNCVFSRNDEEDVYTTGHAAFTTSPDGTETWMTYHACVNTTHIEGFRIARIEKIDWNEDGTPSFPRPHGYNHPQPVPSGQGRL